MQRVSPKADRKVVDDLSTLDLNSVHCNANCGAALPLRPNIKYFLTSCGHVLCEGCKTSAGVQCPVCRAPLKVMELSSKMEPNVRMYFEESITKFGDDLSRFVSEKMGQLRNVTKFQKSQRCNLLRLFAVTDTHGQLNNSKECTGPSAQAEDIVGFGMYVKLEGKNKKLADENARLMEKQKEMSGRLLTLESQMQKRGRSPKTAVSPDMAKRALFQNNPMSTNSNIGQFLPASSFETPVVPMVKEPAREISRVPLRMKNVNERSNLCQNYSEARSAFNHSSTQNSGMEIQQHSQQQPGKSAGGYGTFRPVSWGGGGVNRTLPRNWSPLSSVSSYQFTRKF